MRTCELHCQCFDLVSVLRHSMGLRRFQVRETRTLSSVPPRKHAQSSVIVLAVVSCGVTPVLTEIFGVTVPL